jgi:hypothetical protein
MLCSIYATAISRTIVAAPRLPCSSSSVTEQAVAVRDRGRDVQEPQLTRMTTIGYATFLSCSYGSPRSSTKLKLDISSPLGTRLEMVHTALTFASSDSVNGEQVGQALFKASMGFLCYPLQHYRPVCSVILSASKCWSSVVLIYIAIRPLLVPHVGCQHTTPRNGFS